MKKEPALQVFWVFFFQDEFLLQGTGFILVRI